MGRQGDSDGTVGGIFGWGDSFGLDPPRESPHQKIVKSEHQNHHSHRKVQNTVAILHYLLLLLLYIEYPVVWEEYLTLFFGFGVQMRPIVVRLHTD